MILLGTTFVIKSLVLDNVGYVSLPNNQISIDVSKNLISSSSPNFIPIEGYNFKISNIKYFYNQNWAIVYIQPINNWSDSSILILHKINGGYKTVLGPDSSFYGINFKGIPNQITTYLKVK